MNKPRLCSAKCGAELPRGNSLVKACSPQCALTLARASTAKKARKALFEQRKQTRADKARIKTRAQWMKETQIAFNSWIRERDYGKACISCGRRSGAKMNAGHYRTVKASPETRFNPDNCHLQCEHCNSYLSGNIREYRIGLLAKIGQSRLDAVDGPHAPRKYPIDELKELKLMFSKMRKSLEMDRL